jgi:hypothetical protein
MSDDLIKRLEEGIPCFTGTTVPSFGKSVKLMSEAAAALSEAQATIARLEAALRPFALMADQVEEWQKGARLDCEAEFKAADLFNARAALSPREGEGT